MAMAHSTANWHWKNKNCTKWGQAWFERELVGVAAGGDGGARVTRVDEVDGDVELGQRKSKCARERSARGGWQAERAHAG
jgi:activator of HSP90 ATPase